jgi:hypothetical protein
LLVLRVRRNPVVLSNTEWTPLTVKVVNHDNVHENYVDDLILEEDIYVDDEPFYVDDEPFVAERVKPTHTQHQQNVATKRRDGVRTKKDLHSSSSKRTPKILSHTVCLSQEGNRAYKFNFETENGISRTENGHLKNVGKKAGAVMSGSYSYTGPDGILYTINYIADELGFRAEGAHLPVPVQPIH